jgi:protein gp37
VLVSLCDPFEGRSPGPLRPAVHTTEIAYAGRLRCRQRLFRLIRATPAIDWLLLTKRPQNFLPMLPMLDPALPNLWLGVSICDQDTADERIPLLLQAPAAVRWVSLEPALGPVRFRAGWLDKMGPPTSLGHHLGTIGLAATGAARGWVVIGCESGPGARPMELGWADSVVQQCAAAGVPCFAKQLPLGGPLIIKSAELARHGYPVQLPEVRR